MYIIIILLTYLLNVGIINFIQFLINLIFSTNFNYNVWLLAILFIIANAVFNSKSNSKFKL